MKVRELIERLSKVDQEARVFMGYDGNVVVSEPSQVIVAEDPRPCWWSVKLGDVVILNDGK